MAIKMRKVKVDNYPLIHQIHINVQMSADDATRTKCGTIIPLITADEAQVASTKKVNPRNSAFAVMDESHCCPQSKVDRISGTLQMDLTKAAINTDNIRNLKIMVMPIAVAFESDGGAQDERTSLSVYSILELQTETTDRQVFPIYNGTDLQGSKRNLGADQLGLTTDEKIEGIAFDIQGLYDALSFFTNSAKLAQCIGNIKYLKVSSNNTKTVKFNINIPSKVKSMNPYTFFGLLIYIPQLGTESQYGIGGDTTAVDHVHIDLRAQYLEWNPNFNMESNV